MKFLALFLAVILAGTQCQATEWISLSRTGSTQAEKILKADSESETVIEINVPGYKISETRIGDSTYSVLDLDGSSVTMQKGAPELRKITALVKVPPCTSVKIEKIGGEYVSRQISPLIPSKGNITRNIIPDSVPYTFGKEYDEGWYPADNALISVSEPFQMRDMYGVRIEAVPFQYNHETKTLKIYTKLVLSVKSSGFMKSREPSSVSKDFSALYQDAFINGSSFACRALSAPEETKKLLIITHDSFYNSAKKLQEWKIKTGFNTTLVKISEIGSTASALSGYLQNLYNNGNLCFIVLIGDSQHIPTLKGKYENADSDPCYVKLAGNDNLMDAFISRISVETPEQAEYVVMKSINYEKYPMQGSDATWYKKGLGIASAEGSPKDYERVDALNSELKNKLSFDITTCYDSAYSDGGGSNDYDDPWNPDPYNPYNPWNPPPPMYLMNTRSVSRGGADKQIIHRAVNEGISIINYCGHGSDTSWVSSGFNNSDAAKLNNGMKLPVIWSVACVNGNFVNKTCFAESWLRAGTRDNPAGCIGIAAASTNMSWVPPCVWQKHIIIEETCKKKHSTAIVQHLFGVLKCMEEYGVTDKSEGNQLLEQTHYFGDGTVALRTEAPRAFEIEKSRDGNTLTLKLRGVTEKEITITAYNENLENVVTVRTNTAEASLALTGQTHYTVFGADIIPLIDEEI